MKSEADSLSRKRAELEERFRFTDPGHPAVKTLYCFALEREVGGDLAGPTGLKNAPGKGRRESAGKVPSPIPPMELLLREIALPAVPAVLLQLLQVINDPKCSAGDLAEVIGMDTGLSSHLLRTVNSAYYHFPFPIDTVKRAVALMGIREISLVAFSTSFMRMFNRVPAGSMDLEGFWRHSLACGTAARIVAEKCGKENPERHFLAGLLHDVGRLVLSANLPAWTRDLLEVVKEKGTPLNRLEAEVFGFDHARFGGSLLKKWNFPSTLVAAVRCHHQEPADMDYDEPLTVHLADIIVKALGFGMSGDLHIPPLHGRCWEALRLCSEDLVQIVSRLEGNIGSTFKGLAVPGTGLGRQAL